MAYHTSKPTRRGLLKAGGVGIGTAFVASRGQKRAAASNQDDSTVENEWESQGLAHNIVKEVDVPIPMRDGLELAANVYRPEEPGNYPVLMAFTAYGKDIYWGDGEEVFGRDWPGEGVGYEPWSPPVAGSCTFEAENHNFWVPQGYVVIVVDPRGFARSPGSFEGYSAWGRDMYDAIEWAGEQEWSNGNVGLSGVSILSTSQYYAANLNPPHLKAICPWEGGPFTGYPTHGGIGPQTSPDITGTFNVPHDPAWEGPDDEDPPDPLIMEEDEYFEGVSQPALICGTWSSQGVFTRRDIRAYRKLSSEHKWLYTHGREKWAAFYETEAQAFRKLFFDHFLKGTDDRILDVPSVRVEVRNRLREWSVQAENDFPIPDTEYRELYLDANSGELSEDRTPAREAEVSYDSTELDRVTFDFTFDRDTALVGYQRLKLWVTPEDATDADLFVAIRKLDSSGEEVKFTGYGAPLHYPAALGFLRVSHRKLDNEKSTRWEPYLDIDAEPEEVAPGETVECHIPILPSGTFYGEGETLRVEVSGSWLGEEDLEVNYPARGKGETPYAWETINEGEHTIHTGRQYDSSLLIPDVTHQVDLPQGPPSNPGQGPPDNPGGGPPGNS